MHVHLYTCTNCTSRSAFQRWLKLSSAYAESPLRVGCLEWPLRISPSHSLQLQSAAAIKALNPIKSRHAQVHVHACAYTCTCTYTCIHVHVQFGMYNIINYDFVTVDSCQFMSKKKDQRIHINLYQILSLSCTHMHTCACTCSLYHCTVLAYLQPVSSGLLLYSLPFKSLDPSHHDTGIWSEALRISSHLANSTASTDFDDHTPFILLESYRLARQQGNLKHAHFLIMRQIQEYTGEREGPVEALNAATNIKQIEKLRIMRELAKLYTSKGQSAAAVDLLSASIVNYCQTQQGAKTSGPLSSGSELAARSLLTMVKWMQGDSRLMQAVWSTEYETSLRLNRLLSSEVECRKSRMGLYAGADLNESCELFQPDDSVARFDKHEYAVGQLLHLATIHCPDLAKGWWHLAGWCYRIGRKNLEALR